MPKRATAAKRDCIECSKRAKLLGGKFKGMTKEPFFCSTECAVCYALANAEDQEYWCEIHGQWYRNTCDQCEEDEEEKYRDRWKMLEPQP